MPSTKDRRTGSSKYRKPLSSTNSRRTRPASRGQLDTDVAGSYNFDSPHHHTATIISKGEMAGRLISDVKSELEGERVGDCQ
jgi:hypothetical protein